MACVRPLCGKLDCDGGLGAQDPDMLVGSSPSAAVHNTPDQARTQVIIAPLFLPSVRLLLAGLTSLLKAGCTT